MKVKISKFRCLVDDYNVFRIYLRGWSGDGKKTVRKWGQDKTCGNGVGMRTGYAVMVMGMGDSAAGAGWGWKTVLQARVGDGDEQSSHVHAVLYYTRSQKHENTA